MGIKTEGERDHREDEQSHTHPDTLEREERTQRETVGKRAVIDEMYA